MPGEDSSQIAAPIIAARKAEPASMTSAKPRIVVDNPARPRYPSADEYARIPPRRVRYVRTPHDHAPIQEMPDHPPRSTGPACPAPAAGEPPRVPFVVAVIVTYHPEPQQVQRQLDALSPQVAELIVVDNGSTAAELAPLRARAAAEATLSVLELGSNRGVGCAQNCGIEHAIARGASHVLLMDQDSVPAGDLVAWLLQALDAPSVAAAGPRIYDPRTRSSLDFLAKTTTGYRRLSLPETSTAAIDVDHLIASGCLIPSAVLARIGLMDETLFIDAVDTDWCLRARAAGLRLVAEGRAVLEHSLGSRSTRVRFGGRVRTLAFHPPLRQYYIFRNNLLLCRRPHADRAWRRHIAKVLPRRFVLYLVLGPRRFAYLREIAAGIRDAVLGRTGARR